uniref:Uncharacterized protein n=1 Tax=Periophthalmus magnuspinnatus TaxID=409849 RepID=A0A3B4BGG0_9GOBI
ALDVSVQALRGGHLEFITHQIQDEDTLAHVRVGLMTYDNRVHLYDLSPALSRPHMLVITETDELQMPISGGLLVPLKDSIDSALNCPGKLLIFHAAPLIEMGTTQTSSAVSLVRECVRQGCSVHLFHLSQDYILCFLFSADMRVLGCYGLFLPGPNPSSVPMASVDWWTTLALELEHVRNLDETKGVAIQTALSYTTWTGERRTRVHTVILKCSRHLQDAFRHYQAQTLLTFYSKKMYCAVLERPLQELREELQTQITEALACYRKHCSGAPSVPAGFTCLHQQSEEE